MIVREANVLTGKGFTKAAELLYSVAQTPAASAENATGETGRSIFISLILRHQTQVVLGNQER